ncbi:extracellular solute-binding protein [Anaerolineales bacterium HSG25]|nr:extracellular solute-binding protein [Anaerolineales bacterium HSG25]
MILKQRIYLFTILFFLTIVACGDDNSSVDAPSSNKPDNAIEISIIYAPESDAYLPEAIADFNQSYVDGKNPVTGQALGNGERPIWVTGEPGSSGKIHQGIINAILAPNNANVVKPTIFSPSVSHWLSLVNYQTGQNIFDVADSPPTALAPVVMAIWESRLKALQEANGGQPIGWEELIEVLNSENGWADYGIEGDRSTVYYGHTDPYISSTALSTLIAEFYASTRYNAGEGEVRRLEMSHVQNEAVQEGVRQIESLIRHYSARTTEFKEYIAQGPDYLDFVALEENDLIYINQGKTRYKPPEPLVALYPKEGTFWHEHPFAVPNTDWVTDEQREAAKIFTEYIRTESVQKKILEAGFRPVNANVPLGYPITTELGVDPDQPANVLNVPDPDVTSAVQDSWQYVKKQGDVLLVIDVSGSMEGDKMTEARNAANLFLESMPRQNQVGLMAFSEQPQIIVPLSSVESSSSQISQQINALEAYGDTALYDAIIAAVDEMTPADGVDDGRIKAILVLSDGEDTASQASLNDVTRKINEARTGKTPILVIPVAYGAGADISALNGIARASATKVQSGAPEDILDLLTLISSYF